MKIKLKYIVVVAVVISVAACDLMTKRWAERNLASYEHPLPVVVETAEEGLTLKEIFERRFPGKDADYLLSVTEPLDRNTHFSPDDKVYSIEEMAGNLTGFYLFHKGDFSVSPRRLDRREFFKAERALRAVRPDLSQAEIRRLVKEHLSAVTFKDFVLDKVPQIEEEEAEWLIKEFLFPARQPGQLRADMKVKPGDVFLVNDLKIELVTNHLQLIYAENPGAAWGLFADADEDFRQWFFSILTIVAIFVIGYLFFKMRNEKLFMLLALGAITGGAIGNLTDRLTLHYVVDFIDMYYGDKHWPTYNIADIAITVGVAVLLITSLFTKKKKEEPQRIS